MFAVKCKRTFFLNRKMEKYRIQAVKIAILEAVKWKIPVFKAVERVPPIAPPLPRAKDLLHHEISPVHSTAS